MDIKKYWQAVLKQERNEIRKFFREDAFVNWHNTKEHFTVEEFICVNCEYPGDWDGKMERMEQKDNLIITVMHVFTSNREMSFHVTSFIELQDDKITFIDEYWGDDGVAPQWRLDKHIGSSI